MPPDAPNDVDLSTLAGPWQVIALSGATGAGSGMNEDYTLLPTLANGKHQWANGVKTISAHSNGDWLVKDGSTVLYRKTGSKPWPWVTGSWAGENSGTGTLALARKTAVPNSVTSPGQEPPAQMVITADLTGDGEQTYVLDRVPDSVPAYYSTNGDEGVVPNAVHAYCFRGNIAIIQLHDGAGEHAGYFHGVNPQVSLPSDYDWSNATALNGATGTPIVRARPRPPVSVTL